MTATASSAANKVNSIVSSPKLVTTNKTAILTNQIESVPRFSFKVAPAPSSQKPPMATLAATTTPTNQVTQKTLVSSTVTTATVTTSTVSPAINYQQKQPLNIPVINSSLHSSINQNFFIAKSQQPPTVVNNVIYLKKKNFSRINTYPTN